MFGLGIWELLIILGIVVMIFGTSRLGSVGSDLGNAIKGFRSAIKDESGEPKAVGKDDDVIEGTAETQEQTPEAEKSERT